MAVALAGPYANHTTHSRQITTQANRHSIFYKPDVLPDLPSNRIKALKAVCYACETRDKNHTTSTHLLKLFNHVMFGIPRMDYNRKILVDRYPCLSPQHRLLPLTFLMKPVHQQQNNHR